VKHVNPLKTESMVPLADEARDQFKNMKLNAGPLFLEYRLPTQTTAEKLEPGW
jgi:hypothetical protein